MSSPACLFRPSARSYDLIGWTRDPGHGWEATNPDGSNRRVFFVVAVLLLLRYFARAVFPCSGNACFCSSTDSNCTGSGWGGTFLHAALTFANATGLSMLETDGPYAGYSCSNESHAGHSGAANSVALQSRAMASTYSALQSAGLYTNAPDSWFAFGISKSAKQDAGEGENASTSHIFTRRLL